MKWPGGFARSLLAILAGNIIYFLLAPRLPQAVRHDPFRSDLGLALDFAICAGMYGAMRWWWPPKK